MASVKIMLNKYKEKSNGTQPVVMQIIKERKKKLLFLGHYVKPEHWDYKASLPTSKHPNSARLKNLIRSKLTETEKIILDLEDTRKPFTVEDIVDKLIDPENSDMSFGFVEITIE